ncbi:dolichol phosphate-mannose biosynthesis regulatory, partial [Sparassis latifolia]
QAVTDKTLGGAMLLLVTSVFSYYTIWAILLPLFESSNPIHDMFPSREWAVRIPAFLLIIGMSAIGLFVGSAIVADPTGC